MSNLYLLLFAYLPGVITGGLFVALAHAWWAIWRLRQREILFRQQDERR